MENQLTLSKEEFCEALTHRREVDEYGTVIWYNADGQSHRVNGPAIEYADGSKYWYVNGQRHRNDGPAIEWPDGMKSWYLNGKRVEHF